MLHCLYQEFYKTVHRKVVYFSTLLIPIFMIIIRVAMGTQEHHLLAMTNDNSNQIIPFVIVIVCSTLFTMEYQDNAILTVLYKAPHKSDVYLSKLIIASVYAVLLHLIAIFWAFVFQIIPGLSIPINWFSNFEYNTPLILNMINFNLVDIVASLLIISLVFVTSCIINSNSVVITVNVLLILIGQEVSTTIVQKSSPFLGILKWNPFNMFNLTNQYYNFAEYHIESFLSNGQLLVGTLLWSLFFLIIGFKIFDRKSF